MAQSNSNQIKENLDQDVIAVFKKTFGASLETETKRYLEVASEVLTQIQSYTEKIEHAGKLGSASQLLFESEKVYDEIRNFLDENLEETPNPKFQENLELFRNEIIRLFGLPVPDEKPSKPLTSKPDENQSLLVRYFQKLKLQATVFYKNLFKKRDFGNLQTNHILSELVIKPLEQNDTIVDRYFQRISGLMLAAWDVSKVVSETVEKLAQVNYNLSDLDKSNPIAELINQVEQAKSNLKNQEITLIKSVEESIRESVQNFDNHGIDSSKPNRNLKQLYSNQATFFALNRIQRKYRNQVHNWHNTMFVLSDDWKLDLEISELKYDILKRNIDFSNYIQTRFRSPLDERLQIARETITSSFGIFEKGNDILAKSFIPQLETLRTEVKRKLVLKMVPDVKKIILDSNIPAEIDSFEKDAAQKFDELSQNRYIKKDPDYSKPTEKSEMAKIAPHTLVAFQMMPDFMRAFPLLKQGFTRHLQEIQNRFEEIPEIINYSLKTSISFFEEKQEITEATKIGFDGMKRAENKLEDIIKMLDNFSAQEATKLNAEIEQLTQNLSEITDNESAMQINLRITKARAVEKSREIKAKIWNYIQGFLPQIRTLLWRSVSFIRESSIRIRKQFTLEDKRNYISSDVSDYLTETEKAINRLPFIYQRLFKIEPLTTFELYTPRSESIDKIKLAYTRWKDGKFAPTAIISEKGWGKTTLLNRFLKLKLTTEEVLTFIPDPNGDVNEFLDEIQSKTKFDSDSGSSEKSGTRKIAIIDGLEKLFESRINGFDHLLKLLQHISDTNKQVFWLATCHIYSWNYLDKTIGISDYFGYHVRLSDFTDEEIVKTIERRHNISGYRLMFLPENQKKTLISFKKQTDFGDQEELKNQYFARMHKIVKGNLSQAFLFWMRSTAQVTEDSVFIEYLSSDYFNFLGSMTDSKLMILKNIVLHNGISYEKHARLFRIPEDKSKLLMVQLSDDGIIVKQNNVYNINPIIYRQVVEHLYLLNILH